MRIVCCIDAIAVSPYAFVALPTGMSAVEHVAATLSEVGEQCVVFGAADDRLPDNWQREAATSWDCRTLVRALRRAGEGFDAILYVHADSPFLDPQLLRRMIQTHRRYLAEYTFADGYPGGMTPEILSPELPERLEALCGDAPDPIEHDPLFGLIQKDINAFDVETELAPVDLRHLRLSLRCDTRRNFVICKRLAAQGIPNEARLLDLVQTRADLLRSLPAYVSIEIVNAHSQTPIHSPAQIVRQTRAERSGATGAADAIPDEMSPQTFDTILAAIERFSEDAWVHLSLWGEAGLHSQIVELLTLFGKYPRLRPMVETSGVGWHPDVLERIATGEFDWITWIVALDAVDPELYARIRGAQYEEALRVTDMLLKTYPDNAYVQAIRMHDNEAHLEHFYRSFRERTENIIIQKYDSYCATLPDRRVTDISPVERHPCWHLMRDITILIDGNVPLCREDLRQQHGMGNILQDNIETIWERGQQIYDQHVRRDYPQLCQGCDEYYTFNH